MLGFVGFQACFSPCFTGAYSRELVHTFLQSFYTYVAASPWRTGYTRQDRVMVHIPIYMIDVQSLAHTRSFGLTEMSVRLFERVGGYI